MRIRGSSICRYLGIAQCHVFSLTVNDVFTLHPLNVGCLLIDILVKDAFDLLFII